MNQQEHEKIAELLLEVYASREPVEPLTARFAGLTVDDAYEIQLLAELRRSEHVDVRYMVGGRPGVGGPGAGPGAGGGGAGGRRGLAAGPA